MNKQAKYLSIFNALIVLFIAGAAFTLSFDAIRELAQANGVKHNLSWLVPLVVDGAMLSFSLSVLRTSLANEKQYWGWLLIIFFVGMSVVFNIAHSNLTPLGMALAALAPLALLATFETLMSQLKSAMRGGINHLANKWKSRAVVLLTLAKTWRDRHDKLKEGYVLLLSERDKLKQELDSEREARVKTKQQLNELKHQLAQNTISLDSLPPRLADYVTTVSNGITPDGDYSKKWDVGVTTLNRANSMFLNGE